MCSSWNLLLVLEGALALAYGVSRTGLRSWTLVVRTCGLCTFDRSARVSGREGRESIRARHMRHLGVVWFADTKEEHEHVVHP